MKAALALISFVFVINSYSQMPLSTGQDRGYFVQNIVTCGLISSINACFNKPKGQSLGKTFINSFWKGCLGGSLNYAGKKLIQVSSHNNTYAYLWPGRLVHSLGVSMVQNGAKNQGIFSSFTTDLFFTNVTYDGKFHIKADPLTIGFAGYLSLKKDFSFNLSNTLKTGSLIFDKKSDENIIEAGMTNFFKTSGQSLGNTIWRKVCKQYIYHYYSTESFYNDEGVKITNYDRVKSILTHDQNIISHEIIHSLQYNEYSTFSSIYINKINNNILKYINFNPNFGIAYLVLNIPGYDNNHFENEANFFGNSNFIKNADILN